MTWPAAMPIETLPDDVVDFPGSPAQCKILVFNPCDGWHLLWTMEWPLWEIKSMDMFTHWMHEPPKPVARECKEVGDGD